MVIFRGAAIFKVTRWSRAPCGSPRPSATAAITTCQFSDSLPREEEKTIESKVAVATAILE